MTTQERLKEAGFRDRNHGLGIWSVWDKGDVTIFLHHATRFGCWVGGYNKTCDSLDDAFAWIATTKLRGVS